MPLHRILDRTGDTRHEFSVDDAEAVNAAEERFAQLTGRGFLAFAPGENGAPGRKLKSFEADSDITFTPQRVGG